MSDIRFNRWLHQSGTGGVSQDSSGNIGIGTTVPTMALDVRGDVNIGDAININNASGIISATTFTGTTGTFSGNVSGVDGTFTGNVSIAGTLTYEDVSNIDAVGIITAQSDIIVGGGLSVTGVSTGTKFNSTTSPNYVISDGTTEKGYIGYNGNDPFIGRKNGVGLAFQNNKVRPVDGDDGNGSNNTVDLGEPTYKFKDAYLTGTVNSAGINATGVATATTFSGNLTGNVTGDLTGNLAGISSIAAISSSISDTAVDVFVYDTTKDSDGGAWRKRTQNTSWYNETLNTSVRGSRKEFPAVAVIVAETTKVTIYDGDDPDLPMWMVFTWSGSVDNLLGYSNRAKSAITAVNGYLITCSDPDGIHIARFIHDDGIRYTHVNHVYTSDSIANRTNTTYRTINTSSLLIASTCNDIAATVLPNAPVDDTTGLPVPTIAVATDGGISVIKDNGNIFDMYPNDSGERPALQIGFTKSNKLVFRHNFNWVYYYEIPNSDLNAAYWNGLGGYIGRFTSIERDWDTNYKGIPVNTPSNTDITEFLEDRALGHTNGLDIIDINSGGLLGYGMHAGIATNFNTGWQHGNIKGAFLSDTDTTNLTGGNKVTNGDAWSGAQSSTSSTPPTGWTGGNAAQFKTHSGGDGTYIRLVNAGSAQGGPNSYMSQAITTVAGRKYKISVTQYHHATISVYFRAGTQETYSDLIQNSWTSSSSATPRYEQNTFTATGTTTYITLGIVSATNNYDTGWDDVVVTEVDEDRSINANGLHSFGTVTKSAVATGAELVAYSGFSGSNVLVQPYNSGLNPGTGDYSFTLWFKCSSTGGEQIYMRRFATGTVTGGMMMRLVSSSSVLQWYVRDTSSTATALNSTAALDDGNWHCAVGTREGATAKLYIDGKLDNTSGCSANSHDPGTTSSLVIGAEEITASPGTYQNPADLSSMALIRYSLSAPSAEQVKKMYNDEKRLFQENAKCTLYGSSDAVTALAYDDTTNLLHVGTSAGRSEFQGLRRINNTTDAVTTAISASNGLVAEQ